MLPTVTVVGLGNWLTKLHLIELIISFMKHFSDEWIREWCDDNGWTDLIIERCRYWAFPPGAVMPEPIPSRVLKLIKFEKGLTKDEILWSTAAVLGVAIAAILTYWLQSPLPILLAFAFSAVTVAKLEVEYY
jgi:hypothetical protein